MASQPKSTRRKLPSMYDVAREAGVSQTAVSFVVNNVPNTNIPQETRDRILAAVEKLGWRPNAIARGLSLQRSYTIGLISDEVATSPHAGKIIQGAQDAAWAQNKMLLVINTMNNSDIEHMAVEMMLERQVESLIYATMYHHIVTPPPTLSQVPIILLDCFVADRSLPSVVPDEIQGGYTATEVLLRKGHRQVGFINDQNIIPAMFGRLAGYQQALAAYDILYNPTLVVNGVAVAETGYQGAMALLQQPNRPTALFCFNDLMAMGAYAAIQQLGLRIPEDVAVVGFDNLELIAAQLRPALTTVALPHYEMGQWAVRYLAEQPDQTNSAPIQHTITCPLIERASI